MLVRTYYSVNGQIRGELAPGETDVRDYMTDNNGTVVCVFQNDWGIAEGVYTPYGGVIGEYNLNNYKFSWQGANGYRKTGMAWTKHYVRARHYGSVAGAWNSRDPLWPQEQAYQYVNGMPIKASDPSGKQLCGISDLILRDQLSMDRFSRCKDCHSMTDDQICSTYRGRFKYDDESISSVACCGSRAVPCLFLDRITEEYKGFPMNSADLNTMLNCIKKHENIHEQQLADNELICDESFCGWAKINTSRTTRPHSECPAYIVSADCIFKSASGGRPCANPKSMICEFAKRQCNLMNRFCYSSGQGSKNDSRFYAKLIGKHNALKAKCKNLG